MDRRIDLALGTLWRQSRFVSYFYQGVGFYEENAIPTIALSVRNARPVLYYNSDFIGGMTDEELIGLLVHEMLHVVLNHDHRTYRAEDLYLQNLAQDMVINSYITGARKDFFSRKDRLGTAAALVLPPGLPLVPGAYTGETGVTDPTWEELYRWLKSRQRHGPGVTANGEYTLPVTDRAADGTLPNLEAASAAFSQAGTDRDRGMDVIRFDGREGLVFIDDLDQIMPAGIHLYLDRVELMDLDARKSALVSMAGRDSEFSQERACQDICGIIAGARESDISSWRHLLKSIIDYSAQSSEWTYSYGRFSRRHFGGGIYAPGRVFREQEVLTVAVDVSGSMVMTPSDIEEAFGVLEQLMGRYRINLVCLDEDLFVPEYRDGVLAPSHADGRTFVYRKDDWKRIRTGSGGTTLFAPLFNRYMKGHREMLVVITDGQIYDIERLKRYSPTVWVISQGRHETFYPPFGRAVKIGAASQRHNRG